MAGRRLINPTYEEWLDHVFGHGVPFYDQPWYVSGDADWWDAQPVKAVDYLTRLFEQPDALVEHYADSQIGQGLYYLVDNGAGAYCRLLIDGSVRIEARVTCIAAMRTLFTRIFDARCAPRLAHLDEPGGNELSRICYMWWDIIPLAASSKPRQPDPIHEACLVLMRQTLALQNPACQESALHGLGHWAHAYPEFAAGTIDAYLACHPTLRPELKTYALAARSGCIQ